MSPYDPFEQQWLRLCRNIINHGIEKGATKSIFDVHLKIDLADGFPILTLKKSFFRGIVEELLWMLKGSTDVTYLQDRNIHIWDANSSREFLDKRGLSHYREGDIGPGYGFQMRHFGADYVDCKTDYGGGFDQVAYVMNELRTNPDSRRAVINLWNPADLSRMALPPCHVLYQFTIVNKKLNCHLYQRSWDILLGWNTSTAALLTHIIANILGVDVGTLAHTVCDCHIYTSHDTDSKTGESGMLEKLLARQPYPLPKLVIKKPITSIDEITYDYFELQNYQCHPAMNMKMIC